MDFFKLRLVLSKIQEDPSVFDVKINNWGLWPIIKSGLFNRLFIKMNTGSHYSLNRIVKERKNNLLRYLKEYTLACMQMLKYYLFSKFLFKKPIVIVFLLGFRRYNSDNGLKIEPFAENICNAMNSNFDTLIIECNKGYPRSFAVPNKVHIRENPFNFSFSILFRWFAFKRRKAIIKTKLELLDVIRKNLDNSLEKLDLIEKEFKSNVIDLKIHDFFINKKLSRFFLKRVKPASIVLTSPEGHYSFIAAAKELGIKIIEIQHGAVDNYHPVYQWPSYMKNRKKEILVPDTIFMFGKYWVEQNTVIGFWSDDELLAFGNQKFTALKNKSLSRKHFKPEKRVMYLYTTAPYVSTGALDILNKTLEIAANKKLNFELQIKLHPAEDVPEKYFELEKKFPGYCKVIKHGDKEMYDLFLENDVHLSIYSAAIFESFELGIPTAILDTTGKEMFIDLINEGLFKLFSGPEELVNYTVIISEKKEEWLEWKNNIIKRENYFYENYNLENSINYINNLISYPLNKVD